ncbi:Porin ompL precursor [Serratia fonticola]|uniref:Porin ompL n=1 Tax=Serratia fonticola TaxID=47917 RepID=A0A4U9WNI0_SERFO|nr:Porin ompL precursor [Serratia fonticola]
MIPSIFNGNPARNDTHEIANYWNFKLSDELNYTFEPHYFIRVNDFNSKNGKSHHWEITNKFSYKIDTHWMPYLELQWLDRWNDYNKGAVSYPRRTAVYLLSHTNKKPGQVLAG